MTYRHIKKVEKFPIVIQHDAMQCGIACMQMVCKFYGREYSQEYLSELCHATMEGVSLLAINETMGSLGFHIVCARAAVETLGKAPLPCILHWDQNHFVVLYEVRKGTKFHIADPGKGLITYNRKEFVSHWISTQSYGEEKGIAMFLEPITSHNDKLLVVDGNHYFTAKTRIRSNGSNAQPGLNVSARIIVSEKTLWQQIFKMY